MSATATGAADPPPQPTDSPTSSKESEAKTDHDLPANTMAGEAEPPLALQSEDPATVAASEELRHTSISDKDHVETKQDTKTAESEVEPAAEDKVMHEAEKARTPEPFLSDENDEEMRERISSPKKKRGRDQDDDGRELRDEDLEDRGSSAESSVVNGSRSKRLEPEKKRVRDGPEDRSSDPAEAEGTEIKESMPIADTTTADDKEKKGVESSDKPPAESAQKENHQTSATAFASSGFASLAASSTSPFSAVGASKPSVFGALAGSKLPNLGATANTGGFGGLGGNKTASGFGFGSGSTPGFGGLGSGSAFGSVLGNGFAGGSGSKLSSFAAPGAPSTIGSSKPAKAFGAPENDEEGDSDGADTEGGHGTDDEEAARGSVVSDEKKKSKLQKVQVDDGESGEATLLQIRAKLFAISSAENGWKERGVGTLKINVPQSCVSWDDSGHPLPGSFDISGLDDGDTTGPKIPRLILRQENTHRVILNTALQKTMKFQDKPSTSAAQIFFTAIEGEKEPRPVSMLLKMSEANATLFRSEVASIQREL